MRRGIEPEPLAVARGESIGEVLLAPFPRADHREASDHRADLVVKEAARRSLDQHVIALAPDIEPVERLDRAGRLAMGRTEGSEIMRPDQRLRGAVHRRCIQRGPDVPRPVADRKSTRLNSSHG